MRRSGILLGLAVGVIGSTLATRPAPAQETPAPPVSDPGNDHDCDDVSDFDGGDGESSPPRIRDGLNCGKQIADVVSLIAVSEAVREIVAARLLGLRQAVPGSAAAHLGDVTVSPTADLPAPQRRWNTWADGKSSFTEVGPDDGQTDGPLVNVTGGVDDKLTDKLLVGLIGAYEASDLDTEGLTPTETETQGWGGGAYAGVTLSPHLVLNALITYATIDTDLDTDFGLFGLGASSANIDSDRVQASGGLTGYWYFGATRLTPSITLAWSKEWQDDYVDSFGFPGSAQTVEIGILTFGNQVGRSFALSRGMVIEPWAGVMLDWTFEDSVNVEDGPDFDSHDAADIRLQAGFNWTLAENIQLSATAELGGLIPEDSETYAGELNLAVQF